jgi:RNA polymerase sigma-70 factor (ECF subfamily)
VYQHLPGNEEVLLFLYIDSLPMISIETDRTLLNAARRMDQDALMKIFDLYSSALYNYALRLCGDPMLADQIVGDVFAKLLDQLSAGNGPTANLRSYLYEMTYHRIVDETRYSRRGAPLEVTDWLPQRPDSMFLRLEDQILFEQVVRVVRTKLTADQRHVIILRFLEEFSLHETAAIIGKRVDHVKVIQSRAIATLRKFLADKEIKKAALSARIEHIPKTVGV